MKLFSLIPFTLCFSTITILGVRAQIGVGVGVTNPVGVGGNGGTHEIVPIENVGKCLPGVSGIVVRIDTSCCPAVNTNNWHVDAAGYLPEGVIEFSIPFDDGRTLQNGMCLDFDPSVQQITFYIFINDGVHTINNGQQVVLNFDKSNDPILQQRASIKSNAGPRNDPNMPYDQIVPIARVYFDIPAPNEQRYLTGHSMDSDQTASYAYSTLHIDYCGQMCIPMKTSN